MFNNRGAVASNITVETGEKIDPGVFYIVLSANCHTTWKCEIELQKREFSIETSTFFRQKRLRMRVGEETEEKRERWRGRGRRRIGKKEETD